MPANLPANPRIVAYVDLDLVGDALIKLPLVRAMRHAFPDGELIWVAGRGRSAFAGALAPMMPGLLDRVIEQCGVGKGLADALGPRRIDLLIDTQSHVGTTLALRWLRPRRFVSAAGGYLLSGRWPRLGYRKPRWLIRRLLDLLELATGRPAVTDGPLGLAPAVTALAASLLPAGPCYVAQATGAGGKHKAWPLDRHVELARALIARGQVPVMILGPDEQDTHAPLAATLPGARFPLQQAAALGQAAGPDLTIALAGRCAAAVAGDCGGGHMLAASGVRMVSLFGPTDPAKFAPWASSLTILRAQDWGAPEMAAIPVAPVLAALEG
ncbi:glycosyltransferase family 9 protein [Limobrevibacterium gyesilva]|uniref:Lipopolysaccharide heptosyltransferase family protein n=1 Tax=Limobrevibacterium gyesilva TaxID=2991712 RepID=A0AA41YRM6_9PROT|nr:glycosyltransferase family 9 protein [Limobrevibacterium gyesilva]MCW3477585.1 lipopolysaccharide heptosyltransferase family protein [Limobrevibacterium gyesilva]